MSAAPQRWFASLESGPKRRFLLERDQEKHVPAKAGMESGFPSDHATS
jgi:hypothetical protein